MELKCKMCSGELEPTETPGIYVCKFCGTSQTIDSQGEEIEKISRRIKTMLADRDFYKASEYCEKALDIQPNCGIIYVYKILAQNHIEDIPSMLTSINYRKPIANEPAFKHAMEYCDSSMKETLTKANERSVYIANTHKDFSIEDGVLSYYSGEKTDIIIPDDVTEIGNSVFRLKREITSVRIPDSVTKIGKDAFVDCQKLTTLNFPKELKYIGESAFNSINAILGSIPEKVEYIENNAFHRVSFKNDSVFVFPDTIKKIGKHTFDYCAFNKVDFGNAIKEITEEMFVGCSFSDTLVIPANIKKIGKKAFSHATIDNIVISEGVQEIGEYAFWEIYELKTIFIPDSVTTIKDYAFSGCRALTSVVLPIKFINDYQRLGFDGFIIQNQNDRYVTIGKYVPQPQNTTKKSGCYIATCVYGSYDCPEVWTLRRFRDDRLASHWYGRAFIKAYYKTSPTAVRLFGKQKWFHKFWHSKLDRLVSRLNSEGIKSTPYTDK